MEEWRAFWFRLLARGKERLMVWYRMMVFVGMLRVKGREVVLEIWI